MAKQPLYFGLGDMVRRERKQRRQTQGTLAEDAGLSVPSVRQVERTRGHLSSFWKVLTALSVELEGQNLPVGGGLEKRLAMLRRRRGVSQRELSVLVGVSRPTIATLESSGRGRLETLDKVLGTLGAGV